MGFAGWPARNPYFSRCTRFIHYRATTSANANDSQILTKLLNQESKYNFTWADFAYSVKHFEGLPYITILKIFTHEGKFRSHTLNAKGQNCNYFTSKT
jgi:hypothetical protein